MFRPLPYYFYRKLNNIRTTLTLTPPSNSTPKPGFTLNFGPHLPQLNIDPPQQPHPHFTAQKSDGAKQIHQIYKQIKNANNNSSLFHVLRRHSHHLQIQQILSIFEKFVYFCSSKPTEHQPVEGDILHRNHDMATAVSTRIFCKSHPPQVYIRLISACSMIADQLLMANFFPTVMRIVKEQLSAKGGDGKQKAKEGLRPGEEQDSSSVHELISIESNIKLIQSIVRILNARLVQIKEEDEALLLILLKNSINYVHVPASPDRLQNHLLWDLIAQYDKITNLKLGSNVVKAIVRDCLKRLKYGGLLKQVRTKSSSTESTEDKSIPEAYIVSSLKRLLMLERFLLHQTRSQALKKEILETKQNNLGYNSFYCIEHKLGKYICELLPKCGFKGETTGWETMWQHIDLLPLLTNHFRVVFLQIPIDVLSKCQLLTATYSQYQACIEYLKNLYVQAIDSRDIAQIKQKENLNRLLAYSYRLAYLLMSTEISRHIPSPLIHNCLQITLMGELVKYVNKLPVELKIITLWNMLQQNQNQNPKLVGELLSSLASSWVQERTQNKRYHSEYLWYVNLLTPHPKYRQLVREAGSLNEDEFTLSCFKGIIKNVCEYEEFCGANSHLPVPQQVGQVMGERITISKDPVGQLAILLAYYHKLSINNCLFPQYLAQLLNANKHYLTYKSEVKTSQPQGAKKLREQLIKRINACLKRAEVLFTAADIVCQNQSQKLHYMAQIAKVYAQEITLLNYPTLIKQELLEAMTRMNSIAEKYQDHTTQTQNFL